MMIFSGKKKMQLIPVVCVVGALFIGTASKAADVPTMFDGNYAIEAISKSGSCQKISRFVFSVAHGRIFPIEGMPFQASGQIDRSGAVTLVVSFNGEEARVIGRMTGKVGLGKWTSGPTPCSGSWHAEQL